MALPEHHRLWACTSSLYTHPTRSLPQQAASTRTLPAHAGARETHVHARTQGCYNYFISAIGRRLDQHMLGWGSADLDAFEETEGALPQPPLCLPSTLPEERPLQAGMPEHAPPAAATDDVRIEVVA